MNTIQMDFLQLLALLGGFMAVIGAAGKLLLQQIDKRLDTRFSGIEKAREDMLKENERNTEAWRSLERDFLKFRGDLPLEYVRREDFIRNQSLIEAKLDAIALHIQNLQLQRMNKNG